MTTLDAADSVDAVYYSAQVPRSLATLTLLACVFDKVYFPGVHLPVSFDEARAYDVLRRLRQKHQPRDYDDYLRTNCLAFLVTAHKHVSDWCVFTGTDADVTGALEPGTDEVATALEQAIFGPPPPNFFPDWPQGFCDGVVGGGCIRAPSSITYPASAILFAAKMGLPLVNDDPRLPVPGRIGTTAQQNAKLLSTILAMECVQLVLPKMPVLAPTGIAEMRAETKEQVRSFRLAMLKLAKELNGALASAKSTRDVQGAAKFIAETVVIPQLEELRQVLEAPSNRWHKSAVGFFTDVPKIAAATMTMPAEIPVAMVLARLTKILWEVREDETAREGLRKRSGLYYLLRLPHVVSTRGDAVTLMA